MGALPAYSQAADQQQPTNPPTRRGTQNPNTGVANEDRNPAMNKKGTTPGASDSESMVGMSDREFMTKAAQGNNAEVQLANLAQEKASSQEVKDLAQKIEQDHKKANEELKEIAQKRGTSLPEDVGKAQKTIDKLSKLSGADFDKAYTKAMVQDHRKDVKEYEKASTRLMDSDLKTYASNTLPTLREHLQMAESAAAASGAVSKSSDSSSSDSTRSRSREKVDKNQPKTEQPKTEQPKTEDATPTPPPQP